MVSSPPTVAPTTEHPVVWAFAGGAGLLVLVAGVMPGFTAKIDGGLVDRGNGPERASLVAEETHSLLGYGQVPYLVTVALVLLAVSASVLAWRRPARAATGAAVLVLAAGVGGLALTSKILDTGNGPDGGAYLRDAMRDLVATTGQPVVGFHKAAPFHIGWLLTQVGLVVLLIVGGALLGRRLPPGWTTAGVAVLAVMLVGSVPSDNCGGGDGDFADPDSNPAGLLAVYLPMACSPLGLAAMWRGRFAGGVFALLGGPVIGVLAGIFLSAADCAFY